MAKKCDCLPRHVLLPWNDAITIGAEILKVGGGDTTQESQRRHFTRERIHRVLPTTRQPIHRGGPNAHQGVEELLSSPSWP